MAISHQFPAPEIAGTALDVPLRALAAAIVVGVVTTASYSIGSFTSGMFAVFPIVLCSSIVVLHPRVGGKVAASVMAYAQLALIGLWLGFVAVYYFAKPVGAWWALAIGLMVCVTWSTLLWVFRTNKQPAI